MLPNPMSFLSHGFGMGSLHLKLHNKCFIRMHFLIKQQNCQISNSIRIDMRNKYFVRKIINKQHFAHDSGQTRALTWFAGGSQKKQASSWRKDL